MLNFFLSHRYVGFLVAGFCFLLLLFGLYLQHVEGLEPCPMCIVQRYVFILLMIWAFISGFVGKSKTLLFRSFQLVGLLLSGFGAFVAARQVWLQWHPMESYSCGRDFYGMIEAFPIGEAIPMIFRGSGDCAKVDWTFLTLSIAQWSFLVFSAIALLFLARLVSSFYCKNKGNIISPMR
jgi:disulfide bond formation protein DsbB